MVPAIPWTTLRCVVMCVVLSSLAVFEEAGAEPGGAERPVVVAPLTFDLELLEPDALPGVPLQLVWADAHHVIILLAEPQSLIRVDVRTGSSEVLSEAGPGPFDLASMGNLLSVCMGQVRVHQPQRLVTLVLGESELWTIHHERPSTASVVLANQTWWLVPELLEVHGAESAKATIHLVETPSDQSDSGFTALDGGSHWQFEREGSLETVVAAQYFTRLLAAGETRLWQVELGHRPRVELVSTKPPHSLELDLGSGAAIEASTDGRGTLHVLMGEGVSTWGRRVHRFDATGIAIEAWNGDRLWSVGAVSPNGNRWAGIDGESGTLLLYSMPKDELSLRHR